MDESCSPKPTEKIRQLEVAYKEGKAQFERQLQERSAELVRVFENQQTATEAHQVEMNKLINQAIFEEIKANNLEAMLFKIIEELQL